MTWNFINMTLWGIGVVQSIIIMVIIHKQSVEFNVGKEIDLVVLGVPGWQWLNVWESSGCDPVVYISMTRWGWCMQDCVTCASFVCLSKSPSHSSHGPLFIYSDSWPPARESVWLNLSTILPIPPPVSHTNSYPLMTLNPGSVTAIKSGYPS